MIDRYLPASTVEIRELVRRSERLTQDAEAAASELRGAVRDLIAAVQGAEQRTDMLADRVRRIEERAANVIAAEPERIIAAMRTFFAEDADAMIELLKSVARTALR